MAKARQSFIPWYRTGNASFLGGGADPLPQNSFGELDVKMTVDGLSGEVNQKIRLMGPGDALGIHPGQVLRTEPAHMTADFDPFRLCAIEFDDPGLPWMFTPSGPAGDKLMPWIALVVVEDTDDVEFQTASANQCSRITLSGDAMKSLPDLAEYWAWAHAQIDGPADQAQAYLAGQPEANLSRLLCPRRLDPNSQYHACVVPVFSSGVRAGLDPESDDDDDAGALLAWLPKDSKVTLPVYYHWRFSTWAGGSFETLVSRLKARPPSANIGTRPIYVADPGGGLPAFPKAARDGKGDRLDLEGALRAAGRKRKPWPKPARIWFEKALPARLDAHADGRIAPPFYGGRPIGRAKLDDTCPKWIKALNLDIRERAAAGFGAKLARQQQDAIMREAWRQVGEIEAANQLLRQSRLSEMVAGRIFDRHVAVRNDASLVQLASRALERIALDDGQSVANSVKESAMPDGVLSTSFRKASRTSGPILKRIANASTASLTRGSVNALASRNLSVDTKLQQMARTSSAAAGRTKTKRVKDAAANSRTRAGVDSAIASLHQRIQRVDENVAAVSVRPQLDIGQTGNAVRKALDPRRNVRAAALSRLKLGRALKIENTLDPVLAAPEITQPVAPLLAEFAPDLILPGLEHVEPDSICAMEGNGRFIAALMAGLNHEVMRELKWRGFPTNGRGTVMRHFWQRAAAAAKPDIAPVHEWKNRPLEKQVEQSGGLILLIRSPLLRQFPSTVVTAIPAAADPNGPSGRSPTKNREQEIAPVFFGRLPPDVIYFGFDLTREAALGELEGEHGWYFVLQEHISSIRFALDENLATSIKTWRDLAWGNVVPDGEKTIKLSTPPQTTPDSPLKWGRSSAEMAAILRRPAMRVAIHADDLLN